MNKQCRKCKETKPLNMFYKWERQKDKRQLYCKICQNEMERMHRKKRRDRGPIFFPSDKVCRMCSERKPISQFGKKSDANDGHMPYCSPCWILYVKRAQKKQSHDIL